MVYDDKPTQIGNYLFERHEGVIRCFPFVDDDGDFDKSKELDYSPCDMLYDLDNVFKSFREDYKKFDSDDNVGFRIELTIPEWFKFFDLAIHESVRLISINRLHQEGRTYSWRSIKNMITPISQTGIDVLNCMGWVSDEDYEQYSIGVIESDDKIIITSVVELNLDDLDRISDELRSYSLLKLDNSGYIKYYVFEYCCE